MMVRLRHNVVVGKRLYAAGSMVDLEQPGFEFVSQVPGLAIADAEEPDIKGGPALPIKVHRPPTEGARGKGVHLVRKAK